MMGRTLTTRRASAGDVGVMAAITVESARFHRELDASYYEIPTQSDAAQRIGRFLADERRTFLVAQDGDEVLGFVILTQLPEPEVGGMVRRPMRGLELGIAVGAVHRDRGVGRLLMHAAEAHARDHGYEVLELGVNAGNRRAIHLYESEGYRSVGHVMAKWLEVSR
jgi:ribosomal protein S18 acetylase RimI-like enzyme